MRLCLLFILLPTLLFAQFKGSQDPNALNSGGLHLTQLGKPSSVLTILNDTTRFVAIGRRMAVLEDATGRMIFEQVQRHPNFKPSTTDGFQYGFSGSAYWFRFELTNRNQENTKHWLVGLLDAATLDYVDLYLVYPNGQIKHQKGGLKRPYVDQGFFATTPFFRIELPPNTPVTAYFRIESSLAMFGKVTVWDEYYNLSKGRVIIFAIWMFLGLFILRSLNNFVLARFIPDWQFRFYALCTFLLYLSTLTRTGVYPILFSGYPKLLDWMNYGMGRLMPLGLAAWMYTLLDNRPVFRPLRWFLLGVMGVCTVGMILPFFVHNAAIGQFNATTVLLMYGLFFFNVFLIWFTKARSSVHFVLPIALCTIPFFLYQLQSLRLITYQPVISQLALLALAIEMVSMSLVLGRIVQSYIKDRIATANELIREKVEVDKLQELDAVKTQFFTNISHEFRTPLTLILGPLANRNNKPPSENELVMMERNGQRLMSLINQLLDLGKLEAGGLKPEPQLGDMAAFFRTVASSFQSLADSRGIQFLFSQDQQTVWASFERDKIEKVIANLLSNALKFTPRGQEVRMLVVYQLFETTGKVTLTVTDTGIGIPAINLPRIFDRFYQVDGKNSRPFEGSGIGLALVHELVKVLKGSINVTSAEGVGTTFTVVLPLQLIPEQTRISPYQPALVPSSLEPYPVIVNTSNTNKERILLIIDDNADIRAYVRGVFEADYQIVEAEDGQQGLEQATVLIPDLVICDLMMPRLDGFGFCGALKGQDATSHIPVVMLTAKATVEDRIEGFALGADEYLTKPFQARELRARVRNLLDKQERLRHYFTNQPVLTPVVIRTEAVPALSREDIFLQRARQVLEAHYSNSQFGVEEFSRAMNLSPSQLLRKLRALTTLTTVEYLRRYRLERATQLLASHTMSVSDAAYQVGFESLPYFTKVFQEQYGVPPSEYVATPANSQG